MVRPARQIPAQIEGPGCAIMLAPSKGLGSCACYGGGKDLLPMGDADGHVGVDAVPFHQPRPQVIS